MFRKSLRTNQQHFGNQIRYKVKKTLQTYFDIFLFTGIIKIKKNLLKQIGIGYYSIEIFLHETNVKSYVKARLQPFTVLFSFKHDLGLFY